MSDETMYVFAIDANGELQYRKRAEGGPWNNNWVSRQDPGVALVGTPSAVVSDDTLYVFALGVDGELYFRKRVEGSTTGWDPTWGDRDLPTSAATGLPVPLVGSPESIVSDGRMYVFVLGSDGRLYMRNRPEGGPWGGWVDRGQPDFPLTGSPSAVVSDGVLYVFVHGTDGELYFRKRVEGSTAGWDPTWGDRDLPTSPDTGQHVALTGSPEAVVSDDKMYVFSVGEDGLLYFRKRPFGGPWDGWGDRDKPTSSLVGSPSAIVSDEMLYVFVHGANGELYYRKRPENAGWAPTWGERGNYGIPLVGSPVTVITDSRMYIFAVGDDGRLFMRNRREGGPWGSWGHRSKPGADLAPYLS